MYKIIPPLQPDMQGKDVANLQFALKILLEKELFQIRDREQAKKIKAHWDEEVSNSFYGEASYELVRLVQEKYKLETSGKVDEKTAKILNEILMETGELKEKEPVRERKRFFEFPQTNPSKKDIANLHTAMKKLKLKVDEEEVKKNFLSKSTVDAIKAFQIKAELLPDGKLNPETIEKIDDTLGHVYFAYNKTRTKKLQTILEQLGYAIDKDELRKNIFGESTEKIIKKEQVKLGLKSDGKLDTALVDLLNEKALEKRLRVKTQVSKVQKTLLQALKIAKLSAEISTDELKNKTIGTSTSNAIKSFQENYKLPITGRIDLATLDKLNSVAASKGRRVKKLKANSVTELKTVNKTLRLNMTLPQVAQLQKNLAFLGYKIAEKEFNTQTFGKTTIKAIESFQKEKGIAQTGHYDKMTMRSMNQAILTANPKAEPEHRYRVRGSVRDERWQRKNNMVIKIFEKELDKEKPEPLAAKKNFLNGFFDIAYDAPIDPVTGKIKEKFHIVVKLYDVKDQKTPLATQMHYNVNPIRWVNFTAARKDDGTIEYSGKYGGESYFELTESILQKAIGNAKTEDIKETETEKQISQLSLQTGLSTDEIMAHVLACLVEKSVNMPETLSAEVFYAFIKQHLPADLPTDLLRGASEWETIEPLTEKTASGIVFLDDSTLLQAIDNAIDQNMVSQNVRLNKTVILDTLKKQRIEFVLSKPILTGNGTLRSLLELSTVSEACHPVVASLFIRFHGINPTFWKKINRYKKIIGSENIEDFKTTVEIGNICINHTPAVKLFKDNYMVSEIAGLKENELIEILESNSGLIPENLTASQYAKSIKDRVEFLYPAISLTATLERKNVWVNEVKDVQKVIENIQKNSDLDFRTINIDEYVAKLPQREKPEKKTLEKLKISQRVHKITADASAGATLIENNLHSSMQIYFMGKERLSNVMKDVKSAVVHRVYEASKMQYMQVLARITDYRREVYRDMPRAITPHVYSKLEIQEVLGDIPNIETLFGSLDYCDCEHCKSLYGPAAYLTDILRFLDTHIALDNSKTVKDILFDRRPDIGNIKLNCINTDTPIPYIDLVCEILENNLIGNEAFKYQSNVSAEELRAMPQYIQPDAYEALGDSDYPMDLSFNLWQEEARMYLDHLRVHRYELMETFQNRSDDNNKVSSDVSIAAEYFGISTKEKDLIITQRETADDQKIYWDLKNIPSSLSVSLFMKKSKVNYNELLELLMVKCVNAPDSATASKIERPAGSCDTNEQSVINLTVAKFDLMHRFIRLWRTTGWKMWELDLLLRCPKIANEVIDGNTIDGNTLVNLKRFKELEDKLKLPFETLLAFFEDINREVRISPDRPDSIIQPLYNRLLQNQAITKSTILAALALKETDYDLLVDKINNDMSLASFSALLRYTYFARGSKLHIDEMLLFLDIVNIDDVFETPETFLDAIEKLEYIKSSDLSIRELDYILNYKPDSSVGLRKASIAQMIDALRKILESGKLKNVQMKEIISFDADTLINTWAPLQGIVTSIKDDLIDADFSVEDANFILSFNESDITDENKNKLVSTIKKLQQNASNRLATLSEEVANQIKSNIATSFGLSDEQAAVILDEITISSDDISLLEKLSDQGLIEKDSEGNYKKVYNGYLDIYTLLHKISLLVLKMKIETKDLKWFLTNHAKVGTIDFSELPLNDEADSSQFFKWCNLYLFLDFKSKFPEPEDASLRSILDLAIDPNRDEKDIFKEISELTLWDKDDIDSVCNGLNIKDENGNLDFTRAELYYRMMKCFSQMNLTGVDAATMFGWAIRSDVVESQQAIAKQILQAVKSKYELEEWFAKITPMQDALRVKKRAALVAYLLDDSQRKEDSKWEDVNALYKYFLIDVEMDACQLTSRMKQALSSVQLFVQRCFLGLENRYVKVTQQQKDDTSSPNAWSQWKWMKNYRVWEANRKIFFYPENWLEPELRDDKSPFFKELENELMQNEVTKEHVEEIFQNYLHKIDEVSHLELCGMYHQMEDLDPSKTGYETNIVHVVGKTKSVPHIYYYRTYDMNYSTWSAWEKIDVDITGDQVVPVVYNRKLHLFWLQFMEKPMKTKKVPAAKPTDGPTDAPEPLKVLEIQLGWSIKKSGGWTSKKISKQKLIHPWERPHYSYDLKPYYLSKYNELYLDIYLSTSKEFNDGKFYDPNKKLNPTGLGVKTERNSLMYDIEIYYSDSLKNPTYLTKNRFNETYLPWHSSSFIFNGEIKDIKLKGLGGRSIESGKEVWNDYDSYDYVHSNFGEAGEEIKELDPKLEYGPRLKLPIGMHFHNTHLMNNRQDSKNDVSLRILENNNTTTLLNGANSPFELVITQQDLQLNTMTTDHPMFYQDNQRAFFIKPEWEVRLDNYGQAMSSKRKYRFTPFYHPYTVLFLRELNRDGIDGVLNRKIQTDPDTYAPNNDFKFSSYSPTLSTVADKSVKKDIVDFSFGSANSIYNWELFFHAPLMIANRLMQNQKFEDAMHWFHYIFNPTDIEDIPVPQRYWITKPFFEYNSDAYRKQRVESILSNLTLKENKEQLKAWKNNPFKPHVIARYRPVAYQKNVVMKYIDNLIAWGDMLFKRDTMESINEASLLYMLAYEILGDRTQKVPHVEHEESTFNDLESKLDEFGNARVDILLEDTLIPIEVASSSIDSEPIPKLDTLYFCIPNNDFLSKYWDTVEDRLFKIRHCMNIKGIVRQLPLFEPPINPALLVKAAASGMDIGSVLNDVNAPTPYYRFRIVVQKAIEFCNEVKGLGDRLLSGLEKQDAEKLSQLRSQHEIEMLEASKEVRKKQIDEAVETIGSLKKALDMAIEKKNYYEDQEFMNTAEIVSMTLSSLSTGLDAAIAAGYIMSGGLKLIPDLNFGASGFGGSPHAVVSSGGKQIGGAAEMAVRTIQSIATTLDKAASLSSTIGSYQHREDDWEFQGRLATIEKDQIQFQINAAEIRQAIAEKELENQELQIENSKTVDEYMRNKFSNDQLYSWMITQISTVYFQAYQLAFDMAKKAEKCYQYELGITNSNIIQFGYWDSLKKGLVSGDKLMNDLRKLEAEYLNQNKREFEITKHISLAQMAPLSLVTLKETGKCTISLPEWFFDMDYPGHYMRRIKNVSVSIPCIVGPYTSVNCTLSLLRNETRMEPTLSDGDYEKQEEDSRFQTMFGSISSIATSSAQNDSGMFELNFNDERYLPFEGAGVISDWQIDMPIDNNYFDFASLSDVVLHISYTSRNGGGELAASANTSVQQDKLPTQTARLFSLKHEFSTEWHKFLNPEGGQDQEFVMNLKAEHFPFFIRGKLSTLKIKKLDMFVESSLEDNFISNITVSGSSLGNDLLVETSSVYNDVHHLSKDEMDHTIGDIKVKIKVDGVTDYKSITTEQIDDIYILLQLGK